MSNYPPGAKNDPRAPYNQPDTSHEHEWRPDEGRYPILEDGAAIFVESCQWEKVLNAERGYEGEYVVTESIPCDETRHVRMDAKGAVDLEKNVKVIIPPPGSEYISPLAEDALMSVEAGWRNDEVELVEVNPDPDDGIAVAEADGYRVIYRAEDE